MKLRTALIAHPFPLVVDALAALAAGAGYAVTRARDRPGVAAALAATPDLAVIAAELDGDAAARSRNGTTRTIVITGEARDGATALTTPVDDLAAVIAGLPDRRSAPPLTPRERDIARFVAGGQRNRAIAAALGISEGTVKMHLHNIYVKLGLESRTQLAMAAGPLGAR